MLSDVSVHCAFSAVFITLARGVYCARHHIRGTLWLQIGPKASSVAWATHVPAFCIPKRILPSSSHWPSEKGQGSGRAELLTPLSQHVRKHERTEKDVQHEHKAVPNAELKGKVPRVGELD